MAAGLVARKIAAWCLAFGALMGLCFTRGFSLLGGQLSGKIIALLAIGAAGLVLFLFWKFDLFERFILPWNHQPLKNLLVAAPAFVLGGWFDLTFSMFDPGTMLIGTPIFRAWSGLGSGLVCAVIVLTVVKAARDFGKPDAKGAGRQMLLLALGVNILAGLYCGTAATVYFWDNAGYWNVASAMAAAPFGIAQLQEVLVSTITMEYNQLLALPISLVMRLLGDSRTVFVFSIVNLYLLPGLFCGCLLTKGRKNGGIFLALLTPMFTYLALLGFVDVAACSLSVWAFYLYTRRDRPAVPRGILAGTLLMATFLLRRYFLFFAVSFGVAALGVKLITDRRKWGDFAALFTSCAVTALFFTQSFLVDKLTTNYGDLYSAYKLGLHSDWMLFCRYFGLAILALAVFLAVFLLIRHKNLRPTVLLALLQGSLCFVFLTRMQSHGQQHLLLYLPAVLVIFACIPKGKPAEYGSWILAGVTTVTTLLPLPQPANVDEIQTPAMLPSFTFSAPKRGDMGGLLALRGYVDGLSAQAPKTAAIVSSSFLFNGDIYENLYHSLGIPQGDAPQTRIIYMGSVDKRDGFSWNVLTADYLVVADPVQTHLGEENQQIMALLAHAVLDGEGLGEAYRPMEASFPLADGVTVYVYERVREITPEERQALSETLTALYPDYEALYGAN